MMGTRAVQWIIFAWITATHALFQISKESIDYRIPKSYTKVEANMTIAAVSNDWIEINYDLDDDEIYNYSFVTYTFNADLDYAPCPPYVAQQSDRKLYTCRIEGLKQCTEYDLTYYGIIKSTTTIVYYSQIPGMRTTADECVCSPETIPPGNLTCNASESGILTVEWLDPFPEDCLVSFLVTWDGQAIWNNGLSVMENDTTSGTTYTIQEAIPEADYTVTVTVMFDGETPGGTVSTTCTTLPAESSAPQNVTLNPSTNDITVNWDTPEQLNGVVSQYNILAMFDDGSVGANVSTGEPTNEIIVPELAACSSYQVTVAAVNGAGPGAASDPQETTTLSDDDVNPNISLSCYNISQGISVEWSDVLTNCGPSTYNLRYSAFVAWDESKNIPEKNAVLDEELTFQVPAEDYVPGAEYSFVLTTDTRTGSCDVKSNDEQSGPPALTVMETGTTYLYLTWESPTAANGVIDGYELTWIEEEGSISRKELTIGPVNEHNLTVDVFACSFYEVALSAHNGAGAGESDSKPAETLQADISGLECEVASDRSVLVSWTPATANCDGNGTTLSWQGQSMWDDYQAENSTFLEGLTEGKLLTELHPYTNYEICISLSEEWAEESCCEVITEQGVPTAPENVEFETTVSSIYLTWEESETWNGIPTKYVVACPDEDFTEDVDTNSTEVMISELRESTKYSISVEACNEEQCSKSSTKDVTTKGISTKKSDTGLIVGLTLGSVCFVVIIAFFVVRQRQRRNQLDDQDGNGMGSHSFPDIKGLRKFRGFRRSSVSSDSSGTTDTRF